MENVLQYDTQMASLLSLSNWTRISHAFWLVEVEAIWVPHTLRTRQDCRSYQVSMENVSQADTQMAYELRLTNWTAWYLGISRAFWLVKAIGVHGAERLPLYERNLPYYNIIRQ